MRTDRLFCEHFPVLTEPQILELFLFLLFCPNKTTTYLQQIFNFLFETNHRTESAFIGSNCDVWKARYSTELFRFRNAEWQQCARQFCLQHTVGKHRRTISIQLPTRLWAKYYVVHRLRIKRNGITGETCRIWTTIITMALLQDRKWIGTKRPNRTSERYQW